VPNRVIVLESLRCLYVKLHLQLCPGIFLFN